MPAVGRAQPCQGWVASSCLLVDAFVFAGFALKLIYQQGFCVYKIVYIRLYSLHVKNFLLFISLQNVLCLIER